MAHREVVLVNKTAPPVEPHHRGNFNQVRVEIRVIFPPHIKEWEAIRLIELAADEARLNTRRRLHDLRYSDVPVVPPGTPE